MVLGGCCVARGVLEVLPPLPGTIFCNQVNARSHCSNPIAQTLQLAGLFPGGRTDAGINSSASPCPEWSNLTGIQIPEEGL